MSVHGYKKNYKYNLIMKLSKYSFGIGDRFGLQGKAQLKAIKKANEQGIALTPVWNKSYREHTIIGSNPEDVRKEADQAVKELNFHSDFFVDADHINFSNVDKFIDHSDFFTIDISDFIGTPPDNKKVAAFKNTYKNYRGIFHPDGFDDSYEISENDLEFIASKYLLAIEKASEVYEYVAGKKGVGNFITEISIDETDRPQTPVELFFILAELGRVKVPVNTIAPKFSGRFNKGVDYRGNISAFEKEFREDLLVVKETVKEFGLPAGLKLSVHSGSDKFSIYPVIGKHIRQTDSGIHLKTAGTTWLEEVIGLAISGDAGLRLVKQFYHESFQRIEELCAPYAQVIDIEPGTLPEPALVENWTGEEFAATVRHIPDHTQYNPGVRQLLHVGYKVAAEHKDQFIRLLKENEAIVENEVYTNIFERHIQRIFKTN